MTHPTPTFDAILARPDDAGPWLALAAHYRDIGRDDEAAALRVFWRSMRDLMAEGQTLESVLSDLERDAKILGRLAREVEGRADGAATP